MGRLGHEGGSRRNSLSAKDAEETSPEMCSCLTRRFREERVR